MDADQSKRLFGELDEIKGDLKELRREVSALKIKVYSVAGGIALFLSFAAQAF